jgi:beta-glucosidase
VAVTVRVTNVGDRAADEVVQLYLSDLEASVAVPRWSLRALRRIHLEVGETRDVRFELAPRHLALIDARGRAVIEPGRFRLTAGGSQPDHRSRVLGAPEPVQIDLVLVGEALEVPY